jgi:E3 ubiquitin-protein ligase synoviolin
VASLALCVGKSLQLLLLGNLRSREVEMLTFRTKETILETFLAMSIFREEFGVGFLALFAVLLFFKLFHWIAKDRVDFVEETPNQTRQQRIRLSCLLFLLAVCDLSFLIFSIHQVVFRESSLFVLFAFEFGILLISQLFAAMKYTLVLVDISYGGQWEPRTVLMFWSEIISDLLQLCAYMSFFTYIHMVYALPLHIVRDMYITVRRLQKHYTEYLRYKQVIKTMNQRFPDATVEELDRMDRTCIICREDMRHAKKLSCGHVFHSKCLLSWLKRQLSCPTCRAPVDLSSDNPSGTSVGANVVGEQGQVQNPVERRQMENGIANPPRGRTLRVGLRVNIGNRTAEWNPFQEDLFQTLHEARHSTLMHSSPCPPLPRFENLMRNEQQSGWNGVLSNNNNNNRMGSQQTERNHIRFEDIAQQMQKIRDYMRVL